MVIGGGLAGCEAAYHLAEQGIGVRLMEMRPVKMTPVHQTGCLARCMQQFTEIPGSRYRPGAAEGGDEGIGVSFAAVCRNDPGSSWIGSGGGSRTIFHPGDQHHTFSSLDQGG